MSHVSRRRRGVRPVVLRRVMCDTRPPADLRQSKAPMAADEWSDKHAGASGFGGECWPWVSPASPAAR